MKLLILHHLLEDLMNAEFGFKIADLSGLSIKTSL